MDDVSGRWFGLLIAYVLPGLLTLAGLIPYSPLLQSWVNAAGHADTGLAGFLFLVTAATGVGLVLSCVRWSLLDSLHDRLGVRRPPWNDANLTANLAAFDLIVEHHYRYYQFYGSVLLALLPVYTVHRARHEALGLWSDGLVVLLLFALFTGSRDTLAKYYERTYELLGPRPGEEKTDVHERVTSQGVGRKE
jgi:hypothetical protein